MAGPKYHFVASLACAGLVFSSTQAASGAWGFGSKPAPKPAAAARVWPAPPEQARVALVQSIAQPEDVGASLSGYRKFSNWLSGSRQGNEALNRPFAIGLDEKDNLCLTDTGANAVCFFDRAAKRWYRWEQIGQTRFALPVAIAKRGRTLFVADSTLGAVIAFDLEGKLLFKIDTEITRPSGLAISGDHLVVADSAGHCVAIFDLRGKFLGRFGSRGAGPGEFNFPTHVATDSQGNIYVTDSLNGRVQVFDSKGAFLAKIGGYGDGPGRFSRPKGIAVDTEGRIYAVDAMFDNVQIFDAQGRILLAVGEHGSGAGEFWLPNGIAMGRDHLFYVADTYNGRVQVFKLLGNP